MRLFSYVVRYDTGFAPNPFFGYCTLATCKPDIRKSAAVGDWIIGTGSADKRVNRGCHLVYAMQVAEIVSFEEYWADPRFERKKPTLRGSKKLACGDNIYYRDSEASPWHQLNSFHSNKDGSENAEHIGIDTKVDRILVGTSFVYFGGGGPALPGGFCDHNGDDICKKGRGRRVFSDEQLIRDFVDWVITLGLNGYVHDPFDWKKMK